MRLKFNSPEPMTLTFSGSEQFGMTMTERFIATDYSGGYSFTPSAVSQTVPTLGKTLAQNIVINPIPSNYGLITWDGSVLTVS